MACVCASCVENSRQLGLRASAESREAIRKAYHEAAKKWHPDRFEHDPLQKRAAEERFKAIHVAYIALTEHCENPVEPRLETIEEPKFQRESPVAAPEVHFGDGPGCFVEPDFPLRALEIIWAHVQEPDRALAMVDLSRYVTPAGDFSQFMLFTRYGMYVRGADNLILLLWYDHLGEVRFVDQRKQGKLPLWHRMVERMSRTEQKYALEIRRLDGTLFYKVGAQVDDDVKKVIYRFLEQKRIGLRG